MCAACPNAGSKDKETIHSIVDEAKICHVVYIDGQPFVIPTIHARNGD
ncbi:MAG: pyridoxamine 5'-phosphate oxidase family protein [Anaerolineae bacterium]